MARTSLSKNWTPPHKSKLLRTEIIISELFYILLYLNLLSGIFVHEHHTSHMNITQPLLTNNASVRSITDHHHDDN